MCFKIRGDKKTCVKFPFFLAFAKKVTLWLEFWTLAFSLHVWNRGFKMGPYVEHFLLWNKTIWVQQLRHTMNVLMLNLCAWVCVMYVEKVWKRGHEDWKKKTESVWMFPIGFTITFLFIEALSGCQNERYQKLEADYSNLHKLLLQDQAGTWTPSSPIRKPSMPLTFLLFRRKSTSHSSGRVFVQSMQSQGREIFQLGHHSRIPAVSNRPLFLPLSSKASNVQARLLSEVCMQSKSRHKGREWQHTHWRGEKDHFPTFIPPSFYCRLIFISRLV